MVPPERPAQRTHQAAEMAAGRTASVVAAAPVGITTYDVDCRHRRCPRGAATADVMMTMVSERGGEASARQWLGNCKATARQLQGNCKATARQLQGNCKATTRQLQGNCKATARQRRDNNKDAKAIGYVAAVVT